MVANFGVPESRSASLVNSAGSITIQTGPNAPGDRTASPAHRPINHQKTFSNAALQQLEISDLVKLLAHQDEMVVGRVALMLTERGLPDHLLEFASGLATCSAARRLQLTNTLTSRQDLEARPWLLWMADAVEPEVRLAAVTHLATMTNSNVQRDLRELLANEPDPRVADAIRRVLFIQP